MVDDDRRIRNLLQSFLIENGFRISVAATAAEAREQMRIMAFDLVVLDIMMPGETGLSLTQSLREAGNTRSGADALGPGRSHRPDRRP